MIGKKSAVYISHRLASTRFCDRIAMFMDGRMAEYGTHDELVAKGGEYAQREAEYSCDQKYSVFHVISPVVSWAVRRV